jgi:hypothetical protein
MGLTGEAFGTLYALRHLEAWNKPANCKRERYIDAIRTLERGAANEAARISL